MRKACKKDPPICGFNTEDNAYEPLRLMQAVMAKTNEVCLRYLDNSMLCSLPSPTDTHVFYPTSACAVKNSRRKMEDRHVVIHDLNTMFNIQEASPSSYFAVFDGHAGVDAAAYSAAHLHQFLAESSHYVNNPKQALYEAFCKTDSHFADKCKVEHLSSGTTAVVALLRPKEKTLYVAWAGDSQALLVNQGKLMQLVDPHKPDRSKRRMVHFDGYTIVDIQSGDWTIRHNYLPSEGRGAFGRGGRGRGVGSQRHTPGPATNPRRLHALRPSDEKDRIESNGGSVLLYGTWRVNGQLAVSRAIGDVDYKPHVIAVPDIIEVPLDGQEDFLVLACDGLWDFVSEEVVARTIYRLIRENPDDTERISQHLVQAAREGGSTDNISVIVVLLREATRVAATAANNNNKAALAASGAAMETALVDQGLDNQANQSQEVLFNGDNIHGSGKQKDDVMFNFTDNYTQNGTDSPTKDMDFYEKEKSNGKRQFNECDEDDDDDDFGPETDVDAVDDSQISPFTSDLAGKDCDSKTFDGEYHQDNRIFGNETQDNRMFGGGYDQIFGGEGHPQMFVGGDKTFGHEEEHGMIKGDEGVCNPFMEHMEKAEKEDGGIKENIKNEDEDEQQRAARDETPTPPADAVHDVNSGLIDNAADSDSEDEWDYIKGEEADKENTPPRANKPVADIPEGGEEEGGPALDAPAATETEAEADDAMSQLNPNAAEFVPVSPATSPVSGAPRLLEDEIIAQSPKRPMNLDRVVDAKQFENEVKSRPSELDDSFCSNGHAENDHNLSSEMMENLLNGKNIDEIPEFQPGSTPTKSRPDEFHFGPNAAPFTPKHLDQSEALSTKAVFGDESAQNIDLSFNASAEPTSPVKSPIKKESDDPMSMSYYADRDDANPFDLNKVQLLPDNLDDFLQQPDNNATSEDLPAEQHKSDNLIMNNDDALQTTDLDKHGYDDEKELASPLEPEKELSCHDFREDGGGITPEPTNENLLGGDFCQLSQKSKTPEPLPRDVELISPDSAGEFSTQEESRPESIPSDVELLSPQPKPEEQMQRTATEVDDLLGDFGSHHQQQELLCERPTSNSPLCERPVSESPVCERPESKSPAFEQVTMEQNNAFKENPFMAESRKEEVNVFEVDPEEPEQKEKEPEPADEDIQATIVVGPQGVIEIEEEPSEYIPSPAAEPVDLEPQVIEPVEDLCPIGKPSGYTEVFGSEDIGSNKETESEKPVGEVEVRTENISPQFAEQAFVMTPSEESKQEQVPTAPLAEEAVQEPPAAAAIPLCGEPAVADHAAEAVAVATGVAAAATAAVAAAIVAPKPADDKKKAATAATTAKKPTATGKTASVSQKTGAKPAAAAPSAAAKARPSAATKASPTKTASTQKLPAAALNAPKQTASKMTVAKPRTIPPSKPTDKKPLANGDVKQPPIRSTMTAKKAAVTESAATKTTARPATTTAARPASAAQRTTASAPKPAPRPATAPKAAAPRTNGTTTATAARLKPTTTALKSPVASKTTSTTTKTATSLTSKATSATKPAFTTSTKTTKPTATTVPAPPKPRVPLSRRPAAETDKQSKEAVNKATANRATATTTSRTGVTALRKVESKTATTTRTTVMKSTTTTMKSSGTAIKKPAEIVRNKSSNTPTKVDKPELNGIASETPEVVVKGPVNDFLVTDSDPELVKDNSPAVDNKTIENTLIQTNTAD